MSVTAVVVLVVGIVVLASLVARKRGYSHNQRIVLSGIAIGLLIWSLFPGAKVESIEPGKVVLVVLGIVVLVTGLRYLGRQQ